MKIRKHLRKLQAAFWDACFLMGIVTLITIEEAPTMALLLKWYGYAAITSLVFQWIEGVPIIQFSRQVKKS